MYVSEGAWPKRAIYDLEGWHLGQNLRELAKDKRIELKPIPYRAHGRMGKVGSSHKQARKIFNKSILGVLTPELEALLYMNGHRSTVAELISTVNDADNEIDVLKAKRMMLKVVETRLNSTPILDTIITPDNIRRGDLKLIPFTDILTAEEHFSGVYRSKRDLVEKAQRIDTQKLQKNLDKRRVSVRFTGMRHLLVPDVTVRVRRPAAGGVGDRYVPARVISVHDTSVSVRVYGSYRYGEYTLGDAKIDISLLRELFKYRVLHGLSPDEAHSLLENTCLDSDDEPLPPSVDDEGFSSSSNEESSSHGKIVPNQHARKRTPRGSLSHVPIAEVVRKVNEQHRRSKNNSSSSTQPRNDSLVRSSQHENSSTAHTANFTEAHTANFTEESAQSLNKASRRAHLRKCKLVHAVRRALLSEGGSQIKFLAEKQLFIDDDGSLKPQSSLNFLDEQLIECDMFNQVRLQKERNFSMCSQSKDESACSTAEPSFDCESDSTSSEHEFLACMTVNDDDSLLDRENFESFAAEIPGEKDTGELGLGNRLVKVFSEAVKSEFVGVRHYRNCTGRKQEVGESQIGLLLGSGRSTTLVHPNDHLYIRKQDILLVAEKVSEPTKQINDSKAESKETDHINLRSLFDDSQLKTGQIVISYKWAERNGMLKFVQGAITKEMENLASFKCFREPVAHNEVKSTDNIITSRLVLTIKICPVTLRINKFKGRFVARGFEDSRLSEYLNRRTSMVQESSIIAGLGASCDHRWTVKSCDITSAFIQGFPYEQAEGIPRILLRMPDELKQYSKGLPYLELHKSIYGLADAPIRWQEALLLRLYSLGYRAIQSDEACLVKIKEGAVPKADLLLNAAPLGGELSATSASDRSQDLLQKKIPSTEALEEQKPSTYYTNELSKVEENCSYLTREVEAALTDKSITAISPSSVRRRVVFRVVGVGSKEPGVSKSIGERYPLCRSGPSHVLGECRIDEVEENLFVASLRSQRTGGKSKRSDTAAQRQVWFRKSLEHAISNLAEIFDEKCVETEYVFPFLVGCDRDKSRWQLYLRSIDTFFKQAVAKYPNQNHSIEIYRNSGTPRKSTDKDMSNEVIAEVPIEMVGSRITIIGDQAEEVSTVVQSGSEIGCSKEAQKILDECDFPYTASDAEAIILVHVDDLLYTGLEKHIQELESTLQREFGVDEYLSLESSPITFCGKVYSRLANSDINISQETYARRLKEVDSEALEQWFLNRKSGPSPLRSLIGESLWLLRTRPDIAFAVRRGASLVHSMEEGGFEFSLSVLGEVNEIARLSQLHPALSIRIRAIPKEHRRLVMFCDASSCSTNTVCGYVAALVGVDSSGENVVGIPLRWSSMTPKRVFSSSTGAELLGVRLSISEAQLLQGLLLNLGLVKDETIMIECDSLNVVTNRSVPREKNLRPDYLYIQSLKSGGSIELAHTPGALNMADPLTKLNAPSTRKVLIEFLRSGTFPDELSRSLAKRIAGASANLNAGK